MKRLFLSAVAASVMAASTLPGFAAPPAPQSSQSQIEWKKHHHKGDRYGNHKKNERRHWKRGQKYGDWHRHQPVRDWQRHHLHRPGPGQEWIRVGNDYILVSILSGVIAGIVAAQ